MNRLKWWGLAALIGLLIGAAILWLMWEDREDPLNQSDAFVYSDDGILHWFELTSRIGKVKGKLYQQELIEEIGQEPIIKKKEYPLTGEKNEKGYEFQVTYDGEVKTFGASLSGANLSIQEQGESKNRLFLAADKEELDGYVKVLEEELEKAIYGAEEKEKQRLRTFFSELKSVYGYLYSNENEKYQLFIRIDEALLQGELAGSLLMMADNEDPKKTYEETSYELNGITDGLMVEFFTKVDGQETKMSGNFIEATVGFDLSFWTSDEKLTFHAVTEEEYKQSYEGFKRRVENR